MADEKETKVGSHLLRELGLAGGRPPLASRHFMNCTEARSMPLAVYTAPAIHYTAGSLWP